MLEKHGIACDMLHGSDWRNETESVSRAIRDAVDAEKIKLADPEQTSLRYRNYVPFWPDFHLDANRRP